MLTLRASAMELLEAKDVPSARGMIDTLEMIEVKTRGNLAADEERMLRSVLTELRMAVVRSGAPSSAEKDQPEKK